MHPAVHVGIAAEIPEHLGTLDLPDIPDPVVPEILLLEARQVEVLQSPVVRRRLFFAE